MFSVTVFILRKRHPQEKAGNDQSLDGTYSPVPRKNSTKSYPNKPEPSDLLAGKLCAFKKKKGVYLYTFLACFQKLFPSHPICHPVFCPDLSQLPRKRCTVDVPHPLEPAQLHGTTAPLSTLRSAQGQMKSSACQTHKNGS